jgi:hypothetical protein
MQTEFDLLPVKPMRSRLPNEFTTCGKCPNNRKLDGDRLVCKLSGEVVRVKWECKL